MSPDSDRNLLFGVLALRLDFVDRDNLIAALNDWDSRMDSATLGTTLVERGALSPEMQSLLDLLVAEHLRLHDNIPRKSLVSVTPSTAIAERLDEIPQSDWQTTLEYCVGPLESTDSSFTKTGPVTIERAGRSRYRVLRPFASGGLGEVFVALDEELGREVALKEMKPRHADQPEHQARFLLEAKITGGLEHPGIVPVYGLGTYKDGRPYYAMRFIRGTSLEAAIQEHHRTAKGQCDRGGQTLALRKLLGRFIDVCDAVEYAHSRGVLHRDLKPANVMLGKYGETLVVDWGLAKTLGEGWADEKLPLTRGCLRSWALVKGCA